MGNPATPAARRRKSMAEDGKKRGEGVWVDDVSIRVESKGRWVGQEKRKRECKEEERVSGGREQKVRGCIKGKMKNTAHVIKASIGGREGFS